MPVYFMQAGPFGDVKIGVAKDPLARMRQLQTSVAHKLRIIRVLEGDRAEEKALHDRFGALRKAGEWFAFSKEMQADLGIPDLPIPKTRRQWDWPDTAVGRFRTCTCDLFDFIGGDEEFAKALGVAPWFVGKFRVHVHHLSALVVLARAKGADISLSEVLRLQEAAVAEEAAEKTSDSKATYRRREREWMEQTRSTPWWPRYTTEEDAPEPAAEAAA